MNSSPETAQKLHVFVSYSRRNLATADTLVEALEKRGFNVTIDRRDLPYGEKWQAELADFIRLSDTVIWLVSASSVASKWCNWELDEVHRRNKRLVPVRIENVAPEDLPRQLGEIHMLPADGVFQLDRHLDVLVTTLETDRAWVKEHTRLADRAQLWLDKGRARAQLLRGSALGDAERWQAAKPLKAPEPSPLILDLILNSRRRATRNQRQWIAGAFGIAAGALALAGFAWLQKNAATAAEQQARSTLALSDFRTASTEDPSRALARLARAVGVDAAKSAIGRRALYLMTEHPHLVPVEPPADTNSDTQWVHPIVHEPSDIPAAQNGSHILSSPSTERPWRLAFGGEGTPCQDSVCVTSPEAGQWTPTRAEHVYSVPMVTFPANGEFAVLAHGVCMEFGGSSEIFALQSNGKLGFRLPLDSEVVHRTALSPDGQLLFVERSACGATIPDFVEKRAIQVFHITSPDKPPVPLRGISGALKDLVFAPRLGQIKTGGRWYKIVNVIEDEVADTGIGDLKEGNPKLSGYDWVRASRTEPTLSHNKELVAHPKTDGFIIKVNVANARSGVIALPEITIQNEDLYMFFDPDDRWFAVAGADGGLGGGFLRIIDIASGLELRTRKRHIAPYLLRNDGRRILAGGGSNLAGQYDERPTFADILGESSPTPGWVAKLAEAVGGWHLDEQNVFHPLNEQDRRARMASVRNTVMNKPAAGNRWLEFAQWYLGNRSDRRVSPYASGTERHTNY